MHLHGENEVKPSDDTTILVHEETPCLSTQEKSVNQQKQSRLSKMQWKATLLLRAQAPSTRGSHSSTSSSCPRPSSGSSSKSNRVPNTSMVA